MIRATGIAGMVALGTVAHAHDPVHTDGDKYKVKIENERVRVLEYKDQPGEKTHQHSHPAFVLVALTPFKRKTPYRTARRWFASSRPATCSGRMPRRISARISANFPPMC